MVTVSAGDSIPDSYIISLVDGASVDDVAAAHGLTKGHVFRAVLNGFEQFQSSFSRFSESSSPRAVAREQFSGRSLFKYTFELREKII